MRARLRNEASSTPAPRQSAAGLQGVVFLTCRLVGRLDIDLNWDVFVGLGVVGVRG